MERNSYIGKDYFDKDYFETPGYKSGYNKKTMRRNSYLNKAIAVWITQTLGLHGHERVLEIGCAFGWVVEHMRSLYGFDCYGQDISGYSTANAPSEIKNRIKECQDIEIVFDGTFDVIYSLETFEHVPKPLVDDYLANIYAQMNNDGYFFATICLGHNDDRGTDIDQSHQTLQPREWWNNKLEGAGFVIRKDLEAEAYELGLQTPEMAKGEWLPREYNWHVFVVQKALIDKKEINNRLELDKSNKPKLLVIGSRQADFSYPEVGDFFHIDNWGNYLSYFFNAEYKLASDIIDFAKYDLVMGALDTYVAQILASSSIAIEKGIFFYDGTTGAITEDAAIAGNFLAAIDKVSKLVMCSQGTNIDFASNLYAVPSINCSHIFPLRWFDKYYDRSKRNTSTILCAGPYGSHAWLVSGSAKLASRHASTVLIRGNSNLSSISGNIEFFSPLRQEMYYSDVLSRASVGLKMDNPAGVGRFIAETAAAGIPTISSNDLYQQRCFPELIVDTQELREVDRLLTRLIEDGDYYRLLSNLSRLRLEASNFAEFQQMLFALSQVGFNFTTPKELYW